MRAQNVAPARPGLDTPYAVVRGRVEHGDERGRALGFPTANLSHADPVRHDGVYAGYLHLEPNGTSHVTVVSVGHRPTFYFRDGIRLVEAHLLDFSGDLYGLSVRVELFRRLRPQRSFPDVADLVRQLELDVVETRVWAATRGPLAASDPVGLAPCAP